MANNKTEGNIRQKANKILNVNHAEVVNNTSVINNNYSSELKSVKRIYNKVFTKDLIEYLKNGKEIPDKLSFVETNDWIDKFTYLKQAQLHISQSFIWVIGEELRRLLVIGDQEYPNEEIRMALYIDRTIQAYRSALQLLNYVFISKLLDEKIKNGKINTDKYQINKFFTTENDLELIDLRLLFQELVGIFNKNPELDFPIEKEEFRDEDQFLQSDSGFNQACDALEELYLLKGKAEVYESEHCETAEKSLATILSGLYFLTKYELISVKHIEYEESRNNAPQYIKEMRIIRLPNINQEKSEKTIAMENLIHMLMYDETPLKTNSVLFIKKNGYLKKSINLFPFLIDYNALDDQKEFDLYYYEHLNTDEFELRYFSTMTGKHKIRYIKARILTNEELEKENALEEFIKDTRIELVSKQFQLARNTILNDDFNFTMNTIQTGYR